MRPPTSTRPTNRRHQRGMTAVMVALLAVVLLGLVGLAVDSAYIEGTGQQLQNAADAAALAAGRQLLTETSPLGGTYTATRNAAVNTAAHNSAAGSTISIDPNTGNSSTGDVVVGLWDSTTKTFVPSTLAPNAVKVVARRTTGSAGGALPLMFGGFMGDPNGEVSRNAIVSCTPTVAPYVIVLDPSAAGALTVSGNGNLGATGGKVQVNSSSASGLSAIGNGRLTADRVNIVGGASVGSNASVSNVHTGSAAMADPLAWLMPAASDWATFKASLPQPGGASGKIISAGVFSPGNYPQGLSLSSAGITTLLPGTYMFGTGFTMSGGTLSGTGVTIFCDAGVKPSVSGQGSLLLTPPLIGPYKGLTFMCNRSTTGTPVLSLSGNGVINCQGSFYVPGGNVTMSGNGLSQGVGQVVARTMTVTGNGSLNGMNIVPAPGSGGTTALVH